MPYKIMIVPIIVAASLAAVVGALVVVGSLRAQSPDVVMLSEWATAQSQGQREDLQGPEALTLADVMIAFGAPDRARVAPRASADDDHLVIHLVPPGETVPGLRTSGKRRGCGSDRSAR